MCGHYLLQDGTTMAVMLFNGSYELKASNPNGFLADDSNAYGAIFIDVNGKKPPNRLGKDQYPIGLGAYHNNAYDKPVTPYPSLLWSGDNVPVLCVTNNGNMCNPDDGKSPTAYVLKNKKIINYKAMGYPTTP